MRIRTGNRRRARAQRRASTRAILARVGAKLEFDIDADEFFAAMKDCMGYGLSAYRLTPTGRERVDPAAFYVFDEAGTITPEMMEAVKRYTPVVPMLDLGQSAFHPLIPPLADRIRSAREDAILALVRPLARIEQATAPGGPPAPKE